MFTIVIRFGGPDGVVLLQPKYLEYVPPEIMPEGRVTMLGDGMCIATLFRCSLRSYYARPRMYELNRRS